MPVGGPHYILYKNTQMQLMGFPFVLDAALRDEKVARLSTIAAELDPVAWLRKHFWSKSLGMAKSCSSVFRANQKSNVSPLSMR